MNKIDFKKELEIASKGMIMIHEPELLIKLIVRMLVRKLFIKHAAMVLFDPEKDAYVLSISRGETGVKVPTGFTRFDKQCPIIRLFNGTEYESLRIGRNAIVSDDINKMIWGEGLIKNSSGTGAKELLHNVLNQMLMLNSVACVPAYYQEKLMAVLLLGEKYDASKFRQEELDFFSALASDAAMAIRNAQLFSSLEKESERNRKLFIQTIVALSSAIEAKDSYTHGHTERVTKYSVAIAHQMMDNGSMLFPESFFENLYIAGLLHDIGKIGVSEKILNKKGKLKEEEYAEMKLHPVKGEEIVRPLSLPKECVDGIKYHHEAFNGKGYPEGLKKNKIPIFATIIAVADAFDAMTSDRPYRKAFNAEAAIVEIKRCIGTQFSPVPAMAMIELFSMKKI